MTDVPHGQRSRRVSVDLPVTIRTDHGTIEGRTIDLSTTGAFVCCQEPLRKKEKVQMVFTDAPAPNGELLVFAEVIRPDIVCIEDVEMANGIGVEFIMVPENAQQFIATLVAGQAGAAG